MKFCIKCGAKLRQEDSFCLKCGYRIVQKNVATEVPIAPKVDLSPKSYGQSQTTERKNPSPVVIPKSKTMKKKRGYKKYVILGTLLLLVLSAGIIFWIGTGKQRLIRHAVDAIYQGDTTEVWNLYPKEFRKRFGGYEETVPYLEKIQTEIYTATEKYDLALGKGHWYYKYRVVSEESDEYSEVRALNEGIRRQGFTNFQIREFITVQIEVDIYDNRDNYYETSNLELKIVKIDHQWYLWPLI